MTSAVGNSLVGKLGPAGSPALKPAGAPANGPAFADTLKGYLTEVNQAQQEAGRSVAGLVTGQTDDLAGVMAAMEKSDVAFKTLLAIRSKLLDAYEELKNMPI